MVYDVVIIGAGPAGMSAGIYCCRKKMATLILAKDIGGQLAESWQIENYLGYNLISGSELVQKFKEHLDSFKCTEFKVGVEVTAIKKVNQNFSLATNTGEVYETKAIVIASGKKSRQLDVEGEKEFHGKGVTYCATCDAPLFKDKIVAVVGGGDSALDAAYQLTKIAKKIYLLTKSAAFKKDIDQVLFSKVVEAKNVEILYNTQVTKIIGDKVVSALEYKDSAQGNINKIDLQGIFLEIGAIPVVDFEGDLLKLNEKNEIIIDEHNMTSVPGIFAAGDVSNIVEKQVIIAAGEGAKAAIGVANYLSRLK
ncbi:MAG: FAD-dependent oxidoreductase [Patescibacteria group bacterium]